MIRSTLRPTQPNCKVDFTKIRKFTFFLKNIWSIQKKAVLLHRHKKNDTKLLQIFNINKLNYQNYEMYFFN